MTLKQVYALAKSYTDKSILGISGSLAGKNCTISSVTHEDGITTIVFKWTADDGATRTSSIQVKDGETPTISVASITGGNKVTFTTTNPVQSYSVNIMDGVDGEDGISVVGAAIDENRHLKLTLSDGNEIDCGEIVTAVNLNELEDVDLFTLSDGEVLTYNETSGKWENKELNIKANITDLEDVKITGTVVDGSILRYDETTNKWVNDTIPKIESLGDIEDVALTSPADGQIITFDGTTWKNKDNKVVDLKDINITNPQNGQILIYDSVTRTWKNGSPGATETSLDDLSNVSIDAAALEDNQVLVYDAENEVWINKNGSSTTIDSLGDINDVDLANIREGQVIVWDSVNSKWINADIATELSELSDVQLGLLADLNMVRYNATTQRWENFSADTTVSESSANIVTGGAVFTAIKVVDGKIGDLVSLDTTDKTTVVNATNEVLGAVDELSDLVGDLTSLDTTVKTNIVNAINEIVANIGALSNLETTVKTDIVSAINEVVAAISVMSYIEKVTVLGDASEKPSQIVQYVGATNATLTKGYFYYSEPSVVSGEIVYAWTQIDVQPSNNDYENLDNIPTLNGVQIIGEKTSDDFVVSDKLQYTSLPVASAEWSGKLRQYIGGTNTDYISGYWYQCKYVTEDAAYKWVNVDVSTNTALINRITSLETNQGDMSSLIIGGVSDIVSALNVLSVRGIKSITYSEPYLTITLMDDTAFQFDITIILQATDLGELGNVIDTNIQDGQLLQYDTSISKYKPYDVATILANLLQTSKDYTDQEVLRINQASAVVCDAKPTYDSTTGVVVYYQEGVVKTTDKPETRFYYTVTDTGESFCTSWIDDVEFTFNVATVDYSDFVSKERDLVNTYTTEMVDKTKVPTIASMDALYAIIATALSLKVNTADIVDSLNSDASDVPLSAKQGKVLKEVVDTKQDILQYDILPTAGPDYLGRIFEYTGNDGATYKNGRFYKCVYNETEDIYRYQEVKFSADYDATVIENSTNAPQGGAVYDELQLKQDKTLETPIVVDGVEETTVEGALNEINRSKAEQFQVTTMVSPTAELEGIVVQYIGDTTSTYNAGYFYRCEEITPATDPASYYWHALTQKIEFDTALSNTSENGIENQTITNAIQAIQATDAKMYPSESALPNVVDYAGGVIVAVGTVAYCVTEKTWHKVSAIDSSTLAVTWIDYDPSIPNDDDVEERLKKVDALPTATADNLGQTLLLISEQTGYKIGGIYKCISDGGLTPTYSWALISQSPLQAGYGIDISNDVIKATTFVGTTAEWNALTSSEQDAYDERVLTDDLPDVQQATNGHTIKNSEGVSLTQRENLQFNGFTVTDDATNNKTIITSTASGAQSDWEQTDATAEDYIKNKPTLGTASEKDFTTYVRPDSHDLVESGSVYAAIATAVSSIYEPHGEITCAELVPALLIDDNVGNVYETSDSGVTTEYFIQGAGKTIAQGSSVGIVKAGATTILFNLMTGMVDLSSYQTKELNTPLTIDGVEKDEVESSLAALSASVGTRLKEINSLPTASSTNVGKIYLLTSNQTGYEKGGVYECQETSTDVYEWVLISTSPLEFNSEDFSVSNNEVSLATGQKIKTFTTAEWNALTTEEKVALAGQNVIISDDGETGDIVDAVEDGNMNPVTSNAVYDAIYHEKRVVPNTAAATLYTEVTGLYPSRAIKTNVYMVTARNGEAYILICGTSDNIAKTIPAVKQLSAGTSKLAFYWDADEKTVAISSKAYNTTYIQQISGDIAELTFSDASTTNPLTNPTEITVS